MVRAEIQRLRPAAVLIEGPSDFNNRIDELFLEHQLPIAIYTYVAWDDKSRQGAYYPFCDYSPEWQALFAARECGAVVRFIDLPYAALSRHDRRTHRYSDGRLRGSHYVREMCRALGVEDFDDAWDLIAEQDPDLPAAEIYKRLEEYCGNLRRLDTEADETRDFDLQREIYMAAHIRRAWTEFGKDRVLVVTGGYHTSGLRTMLADTSDNDMDTNVRFPDGIVERGIALTPYTFQRLDSLRGYDAGMPSPGFYQTSWTHRPSDPPVHVTLLTEVVQKLRQLKQVASTADLIGVETCARSLAMLRGHARVWRRDLTDAIVAVLVKDDVEDTHPFVLTMQAVLRGNQRGKLAPGSPLPPLVRDIQKKLAEANLTPDIPVRHLEVPLTDSHSLARSQLLHQLRILQIPGFHQTGGVDFAKREDLTSLIETWAVQWKTEQDSAMIEASRFGSALDEAATARLQEQAVAIQNQSAQASLLLLDAVLSGIFLVANDLRQRVADIIHQDGNLASVATAMGHLLFLYAWDDTLGTQGNTQTGILLREAFLRATWLLEVGSAPANAGEEVDAVRLTRDAFERAEEPMKLDRNAFAAVLGRVQADNQRSPAQRGACAGALWSLRCADPADIHRDMLLFSSPDHLGDFLTGLFALAREEAQRDPQLLTAIHNVVIAWNDDSFLTALPSLRLAFMYFTAREKAHMANSLFGNEASEDSALSEPVRLAVSVAEAAEAMQYETMLCLLAAQYGVKIS
ncbi:MAG: DUF5682 family protein [Candidatus Methylacidiphilales bacterium]